MAWIKRQCLLQVVHGVCQGLVRQAVHQVQIDVLKSGLPGYLYCTQGLVTDMLSAQQLQVIIVKTLHTDRLPVATQCAIGGNLGLLEGAGVGVQGDFDASLPVRARLNALQQALEGFGREQAGSATADEN